MQKYLIGEDGSGKTTLMAKLQGADHNKKGRGLEYLYLSVHDEDRDGEFTFNLFVADVFPVAFQFNFTLNLGLYCILSK